MDKFIVLMYFLTAIFYAFSSRLLKNKIERKISLIFCLLFSILFFFSLLIQ